MRLLVVVVAQPFLQRSWMDSIDSTCLGIASECAFFGAFGLGSSGTESQLQEFLADKNASVLPGVQVRQPTAVGCLAGL